jgi:hypothetical protein
MLTGNREQAIQINWLVITVQRIDLMTPVLAASEMFMPAEDTTLAAERRKPNATFFSDQACAITKLGRFRDVHACRGHHLSSSEKETQCNIFFHIKLVL